MFGGIKMNNVTLLQQAAGPGGLVMMLAVYAVIIGFMYFILIRPQKKQQKQIDEMQSAIKLNDSVLLNTCLLYTSDAADE